jgi:hypothetical protein
MKDDAAEVLSIEGREVHVTHPHKLYEDNRWLR